MDGKPPNLPLSGITVLSLEQAIAAPLASRHLADWGARVIKIERPGKGDFCRDYDHVMNGMSSQFAWTNRSKESLSLDVKSTEGKRVLDALLPRADVFLQNLAPGAAKRQGLDAATQVALIDVENPAWDDLAAFWVLPPAPSVCARRPQADRCIRRSCP